MDSVALDAVVKSLGAMVNDGVDEVGLVFAAVDSALVREGSKLGVPHGLIPKLFNHTEKLEDCDAKLISLLVCNGDNYTAWARRKSMLLKGETSNAYELRLVDLILSKQPKIGSAWEHRRFVAQRVIQGCKTPQGLAAFIESEIALCERVCVRHPRIYFSWAHRTWLASCMTVELLEADRIRTKAWIEKNLGDASAFNYLERINGLLNDRKTELVLHLRLRIEFSVSELLWCAALCTSYVGHEAIWIYRRACIARLLDCCFELNKSGWQGIKNAFKCLELTCPLTEAQRIKSCDWWRLRCKEELPNLDAVMQVVFDELNVACDLLVGEKRLDSYSGAIRESRLDQRFAGAYAVWLGDRILCALEAEVPEAVLITPIQSLAPGCLRNVEIDDFIALFDARDSFDQKEFRSYFKKLPGTDSLPDEAILDLFAAFDVDNSGTVSKDEFLSGAIVLCGGGEASSTKIATSFRLLDTNGNGSLDRTELIQYCVSVFRIVALVNPLLKDQKIINAIADASVEDAFRFSSNGHSLTCDEFGAWLKSTAKSTGTPKPSALLVRKRVVDVASKIVNAI